MTGLCRIGHAGLIDAGRRMPGIQPFEPADQPGPGGAPQREIAHGPQPARLVIERALAAGGKGESGGSRLALLLVAAEGIGANAAIAGEAPEHCSILEGHRRALGQKRQGGVGGVADQGGGARSPARRGRAVGAHPAGPAGRGGEERIEHGGPPPVAAQHLGGLDRHAPLRAAAIAGHHHDDIDDPPAGQRIGDDMGIIEEIERDRILGHRRRQRGRVEQRPIEPMAGSDGRAVVQEMGPHRRADAVGTDQDGGSVLRSIGQLQAVAAAIRRHSRDLAAMMNGDAGMRLAVASRAARRSARCATR